MGVEPEYETGVVRQPDAAKQQRLEKSDNPGTGVYGENPNLEGRVVVGVFDDARSAEAAAQALRASSLSGASVAVTRAQPGEAPEMSADATKANSGGVLGVVAGAVAGALLALVASLLVPNISLLLPGGLIAAAVLGALVGAALGGLIGAMRGLGVPKREAVRYEAAVRSGAMLVTVKAPEAAVADAADAALRQAGARQVHSYQDML